MDIENRLQVIWVTRKTLLHYELLWKDKYKVSDWKLISFCILIRTSNKYLFILTFKAKILNNRWEISSKNIELYIQSW